MLDLLNAWGVPVFDMVRYSVDIYKNKNLYSYGDQA